MNIFTVTKFRYPKTIEESFFATTKGNYNFFYDHDKTYELFLKENNIENFDINKFNNIKNGLIKKFVFIFYVLYCQGGFYIDINVIPNNNVNNISLENSVFYCVKSIMNTENLFLGILGSSKKNKMLLNIINNLFEYDAKNDGLSSKIMHDIIRNSDTENVIVYLNEKINNNNCASTVNALGETIFDHYYNPSYSYTGIPFQTNKITKNTNLKDIKIGITLLIFDKVNSFFSNGINQNSLFLCELLLNIGYDVYFIVEDTKLFTVSEDILSEIFYDSRFKYKKYSEILYSEFNIIITLSFSYGETFIYNYLKYLNTKHIGYFCGNSYIIETEKILYNQHKSKQSDEFDFTINGLPKYDQIWSIPQMSETNLHFWSILYRCKCIEVPFIWSTNAINLAAKANGCNEMDLYYKNRGPEKKIAIFEPNISIMKWCLPSILICENAYRKNKLIKHLYITNINSSNTVDFNLNQFNKILAPLDLIKDKKCSIETRYNTLYFMRNHSDIAVSHQWGNPLNYLYFDLAWTGWPIVHNAYLCKEVGYFYDNFNLNDGSSVLENILTEHDKNIDNYLVKNREAIDKFLPSNKDLQESYKKLIVNLFDY